MSHARWLLWLGIEPDSIALGVVIGKIRVVKVLLIHVARVGLLQGTRGLTSLGRISRG